MIGENGVPETPDWLPTPCNDGCVRLDMDQWAQLKTHAECPAHVSSPLLWDGDDS